MQRDQYLVKPVQGLNLDQLDSPKESEWTFLQNGVLEGMNGDVFELQTEPGFNLVDSIPYTPIGIIPLSRTEKVIFSTDNSSSEIGILKDDVYSQLINADCLNFSTRHLINGEFRVRNGCERVIIFNDFNNPDRLINIDSLDQYKDSDDEWNCNLFKLNPIFSPPSISNLSIQEGGGNLKLGLYSFSIELLDEDLNSIGFSPISNSESTYQSRLNDNYHNIEGGYNLEDSTALDGGKPNVNKSILLTIDNLDTTYTYYKVWVIERSALDGLTNNVYKKSDLIPISTSSSTFLFTGILSTDTTQDIEEIIVKDEYYERSKVLTQVDNRLVRANLKSDSRDFSNYQRTVNNITSSWISKQITPGVINELGVSKNPNTYFNSVGFTGDEIYAFGIQFLYSSGRYSTTFHIPGRPAVDGFDKQSLTINTDIDASEVRHLNLTTSTVERYKVYNTASLDGRMAYHESDTSTYPINKDCNDEFIYGDLAGEKVRHHRFPDRRRVPVYTGIEENIRLEVLGIEFDNIVYPDSDIVGHRILMVQRTDENKTVLDNGILTGSKFNEGNNRIEYVKLEEEIAFGIGGVHNFFWSPETLVNRKYLNGSYFKLNSLLTFLSSDEEINTYDKEGGGEFDIRTQIKKVFTPGSLPARTNITYDENFFVDPQSLGYVSSVPESLQGVDINNSVFNNSFTNTINYYHLLDSAYESASIINVTNKKVNDPYTNITNLIYKPITPWITDTTNQVYSGDTFISELSLLDLYNKSTSSNRTLFFGTHISKVWVESQINYELIHGGTGDNKRYNYPNIYGDYWISKIATPTDSSTWIENASPAFEYYGYNKNYSFVTNPESSVSLPITYDYCSECRDEYPNRLIYSEKSFLEEKSDAYRIFKTNDYTIIGQNTGEITALHYDKNRMLVRTEQSRFQLAPNPQIINTDLDTAYLGTGDFLSIPPNELIKTSYGYGGGNGKWDEVNTEFGLVSIDEQVGKVYIFGNNIDELSSKQYKCSKFLKRNLPLTLKSVVPGTNDESRIQLSYDPEYKRILINKVDYEPINYKGLKNVVTDERGLVWSEESGFEYKVGNAYLPANFSNSDYFKDKSWVLSYAMDIKAFIGFHTYTNSVLFDNNHQLYSVNNSSIYKQDDLNFTNYYGTKNDFICEVVVTKDRTVDLEQILYYAESFNGNNYVKTPTFDRLWVYTSDQSTGIVNLVDKTDYNYRWSNLNKQVAYSERNYFINKLTDISTSNEILSGDTINLVPANVDFNTKQYSLTKLKDKFFRIRFYFNPSEDIKLTFNYIHTILRNSEL